MRIKSFLSHICLHIRTDLYLYGLQPGKWVLVKVQWCSVGATYIKRMLGACCKTCIFLTEASLFYLLVSFLWVCLNIFIIVNFLSVSARFWPRAMSIPFPGWMSCEVTIPGFSFFVCLCCYIVFWVYWCMTAFVMLGSVSSVPCWVIGWKERL